MIIDKIFIKNGRKFFFYKNQKFYIEECNESLDLLRNIYLISNRMYYSKLNVNTFILNNKNNFYTKKDNINIIVLKDNGKVEVTYDNIEKYKITYNNIIKYDILNEWKNEVDVIENEILEYKKEFKFIQNSINYYIGISENAISLLSKYKENIVYDSIAYKYDYLSLKNDDFTNPLKFIAINQIYNVSNYIKYLFFTNKLSYKDLKTIINNNSKEDNIILFCYLMYPNYYFSFIKDVLLNEEKEKNINYFLSNITNYRNILIVCRNLMKIKELKEIMWL